MPWLKGAELASRDARPVGAQFNIRAYLDAENAYATLAMADTEALQATLLAEMKRAASRRTTSSVPSSDGPMRISRTTTRAASTLNSAASRAAATRIRCCSMAMCWRRASRFPFGDARHSPDHKLIAWQADEAGSEFFTIRVRDIASGRDLS